MKSFKSIFLFCIILLSLSCYSTKKNTTQNTPNIILIMADDMGFETVEANGGTTYKTPYLNQMATNGIRFEHCYSQPLCTPSRVQIMTGIYNVRNYVRFAIKNVPGFIANTIATSRIHLGLGIRLSLI